MNWSLRSREAACRKALRYELLVLQRRRAKLPKVRFSHGDWWTLAIFVLLTLIAMGVGAYLFSIFRGEMWDV